MDRSRRLLGIKPVTLKPKSISENKLKAFNMGTMNAGKKMLSKREQEEKKRKEDEVATAQIYQDFVESFEDNKKKQMSWVHGGTVEVKDEGRVTTSSNNKLYVPKSRFAPSPSEEKKETPKESFKEISQKLGVKKKEEKKKSNLEIFKEELKMIQTERKERHRIKKLMREAAAQESSVKDEPQPTIIPPDDDEYSPFMPLIKAGSYIADPVDEATSTNIYVGNINPKMTEQQLCEVFGKFGPLASVKIMWPRSDEEKARGRNCGFVAFMTRKDGERAMDSIKGTDVMGFEMKLGWGKPVPIPPHPVYIPAALAEMTMPPPPSGLPFNAQPMTDAQIHQYSNFDINRRWEDYDKTLANAIIKVVVPTERNILCLIHRMVEFVVREGPLFEAMIMNREMNNPMFRFLFENQIPAHTYYRWKLFSILQGESPHVWRADPFRMFKGGSLWQPPPMNLYSRGMPENLLDMKKIPLLPAPEDDYKTVTSGPVSAPVIPGGELTDSQRDRLEDMLRELIPERMKVADLMVWCLDHAIAAEEVVECITESLSIQETPLPKKIARTYLVSDILFNCGAKVPHASSFRKCFQQKLEVICQQLHDSYVNIDGRLKAEQFKQRIMNCFRAWEDWAVYTNDFLIRLQNIFLGLTPKSGNEEIDGEPADIDGEEIDTEQTDMFAGEPLPDIDGKTVSEAEDDVDGMEIPTSDPVSAKEPLPVNKFTKSKWETVDQSELEAQAQAVSKWDLFENARHSEDIDGVPVDEVAEDEGVTPSRRDENVDGGGKVISEERRAKLREIEVKVMKYQDELEFGSKNRRTGVSISEQVERYRQKLLHKEERRNEKEREREERRRTDRDRNDDLDIEANVTHNLARLRAQYGDSPCGTSPLSISPQSSSPRRRRSNIKRSRSRSRSPYMSSGSRSPRSPLRSKHKHKRKH